MFIFVVCSEGCAFCPMAAERWLPLFVTPPMLPLPELEPMGRGRCTHCTTLAPIGWLPKRERLTEMRLCSLCIWLSRLHLVMTRLDREDEVFLSTMDALRGLEGQVSRALRNPSRREYFQRHQAETWLADDAADPADDAADSLAAPADDAADPAGPPLPVPSNDEE